MTFACAGPRAPESAASSIVQVEVLVHSSKKIRRITLEAWLDPAQNPQTEKLEWKTIQTGKGNPYSCDPTVLQFLEGYARDSKSSNSKSFKKFEEFQKRIRRISKKCTLPRLLAVLSGPLSARSKSLQPAWQPPPSSLRFSSDDGYYRRGWA